MIRLRALTLYGIHSAHQLVEAQAGLNRVTVTVMSSRCVSRSTTSVFFQGAASRSRVTGRGLSARGGSEPLRAVRMRLVASEARERVSQRGRRAWPRSASGHHSAMSGVPGSCCRQASARRTRRVGAAMPRTVVILPLVMSNVTAPTTWSPGTKRMAGAPLTSA